MVEFMTTQTAIRTSPSPTLRRLLDDELKFSPSFQGHYSNHLAMALTGLDQLGAPVDVLESMFDRAEGSGASELRIDVAELERRLDEVARLGITETVSRRIEDLVDAPSSALFHPAIRLAYGLDAGHQGQVAAALLDWEQRHRSLPVPMPAGGNRSLFDVAADLSAQPAGTWNGDYDLHGVARRGELADALDGLASDAVTLENIAEFVLSAHIAADAFVTLHMVTGTRALLRIADGLDPDTVRRMTRHAALEMMVVYAVAGAPPLPSQTVLDALRRGELPSADTIAERAIADHDPHVIKLANVALVEEARTGDPLYRLIAGRAVKLLPGIS